MIEQPEETLAAWLKAADRVIIHPESTDHLAEIVESLEPLPNKLGFALLLSTPLEKIEPFLDKVDLVQLMAIEKIGFHGEAFDERVLAKIAELRKFAPAIKIQIDGGINLATAKKVREAGADVVVVGSALWNNNLEDTIKQFQML